MSEKHDSGAAVRIELGGPDERGGADAPESPAGGSPSRTAILAVAAAVAVVALLVVLLRPDAGQSADGAPIAVPTTAPPDTTAAPEPLPQVELEPGQIRGFLIDIVRTDSGWLAASDERSGSTTLWSSSDGLIWSELSLDRLPDGDIIGLGFIDGEYMMAVDTLRSRSADIIALEPEFAFPPHDIQIFRSNDAKTWSRDLEFPKLAGRGLPRFVRFSEDAVLIPMIGPSPVDPADELIELLGDFMPDAVAVDVCRAIRRPDDGGTAIVFLDCEGEELWRLSPATISETEAELLGDARFEQCVDLIRDDSVHRSYYNYIQRSEPIVQFDPPLQGPVNGLLVAGGVVMVANQYVPAGVFCPDGLPLLAAEHTGAADVFRWRSSGGIEQIAALPQELGFVGHMVASDDGTIRISGLSRVWEASAPYTKWELIFETESVSANGFPIVFSADGGAFVMESSAESLIFGNGEGEPFEVDIESSVEFARFVAVEENHAIFLAYGELGTTDFFKVPFR